MHSFFILYGSYGFSIDIAFKTDIFFFVVILLQVMLGNLSAFKKAIKKQPTEKCPCRLFKVYVSHVGFAREKDLYTLFLSLAL